MNAGKTKFTILSRLMDDAHVSPPLTERPPFPKNMMIELSNACNHACIFCANPKATRRVGRIDQELFRKILTEARALGVREVGFYTTGDPFVHIDLVSFVAFAKSLGIEYTYLSTNGALADPDRAKAVIDAGLDSLKFSINAGSRGTYHAVHGKDDWDKVIENLLWISDYRRSLDRALALSITYVVIAQNRHEIEDFRQRLSPFVDDIYFQDSDVQAGNMIENHGLLMLAPPAPVAAITPCWMLFARAHVTCEGYLTLCCLDYQNYLAVADLTTTTLERAWHNDAFVEMRRRHLTNRIEGTLCYNCLHSTLTPISPLTPELATSVEWADLNSRNGREMQSRLESGLAAVDRSDET